MEKEEFMKMDSYMALSIVNMKLRDEFSTLEDYCSYMDLDLSDVNEKFSQIGYKYDENTNQFVVI
ncbi:MAG: DUF4250 domain-containing protein [Clostridium sp.]|uniref:DUF4250 domain-containing protein n=1 Tax=Clostridium sp. TaxID=1506 RepID=UPI002A871B4D|nr:DUF4250 domain-containing protein [Clostridium sp.]MDY5099420.1 DUF4250 domain-containing protein [Clostridium sp.]